MMENLRIWEWEWEDRGTLVDLFRAGEVHYLGHILGIQCRGLAAHS